MKKNKLLDIAVETLNDAKAVDINVFDVTRLTSIADYMIIASGRSNRQVSAIAERLIAVAKDNNFDLLGSEGQKNGEWVLVDLGDIIVHVMHPHTREYYQLEKLWTPTEQEARQH